MTLVVPDLRVVVQAFSKTSRELRHGRWSWWREDGRKELADVDFILLEFLIVMAEARPSDLLIVLDNRMSR